MKKILFVCVGAAGVFLSGCTPAPTACFTKSATIVDLNQAITFTNCSSDFEGIDWNFGDGSTSTEENPVHAWNAEGDFLVSITVTDKNGTQSDNVSDIIRVGKRYLTLININSIPADNSGTPWDLADNPDVKLRIGKVSDHVDLYASAENTNLSLPLPNTINASLLNVQLTGEPWYFFLEDVDGSTSDTIAYWELDLKANGDGTKFSFTDVGTSLDVIYTVQ
jgi:PKD repeat protein